MREYGQDLLRIVQVTAIATASTIGRGNRRLSDKVAVDTMRGCFDNMDINAEVLIGEGERDKAPMLYNGERLGSTKKGPMVHIAVDPLEGTNLCATGSPNAVTVLAAAEKGGIIRAPDIYMNKMIVGPKAKDSVSLDSSVEDNVKAIAASLDKEVSDVVVIVLDRERHDGLIKDIRNTGARVRLISDGDLMTGIMTTLEDHDVHAVMGIGGAPEGVIAAAAVRCLGGEIQARFVPRNKNEEKRARKMGVDVKKIYKAKDLVPGNDVVFCAAGVTSGDVLSGVRYINGNVEVSSLLLSSDKVMDLQRTTFYDYQ